MSIYVERSGETIPLETRQIIGERRRRITKAVNREFRNINSETEYSLYVGSFGRGTAANTSDIDILIILPKSEYLRHDSAHGNGQSRLLQAVKNAIISPYPKSDVHADGQVVKVSFSDGMLFEIVPAFADSSVGITRYVYPDSNMGGRWLSTNPKAEQIAMEQKNRSSNGLLFDTCKHLRRVRDNHFGSYHLGGIVIDSFIYESMGKWKWPGSGESSPASPGTYEGKLLEAYTAKRLFSVLSPVLYAPGSGDVVETGADYEILGKVLSFIV